MDAPTLLKIINDLSDQVDGDGNDWSVYNGIIRVCVGSSVDEVTTSIAGELLYPYETPNDVANLEVISPEYNQDSSYREFDVSHVTLDASGKYYIFIQVGWRDYWVGPPSYWQKHNTLVLACHNIDWWEKWVLIAVSAPFGDPQVIRANDLLPPYQRVGHSSCP